jgi:ketosteroid isomerase-like protein
VSEEDAAEIGRLRAHSNRSIQRRNELGVGSSLDAEYVGVIGDGSFVASREIYLKLFKREFDAKGGLAYERTPERIEVAGDALLAYEQGSWVATRAGGEACFRGRYAAMWRKKAEGWKIRSETFVTLG